MQNVQPTLTNVEAQRVMAVVDDLLEDFQLVFRVTPYAMRSNPELVRVLPQDIRQIFEYQLQLEQQLEGFAGQLEQPVSEFVTDKEQPERSLAQEALATEYIHTARALRRNTRDIMRVLKQHPDIDQKVVSMQGAHEDVIMQTQMAHKFWRTLQQLRLQTLRNLATSVEEQKAEEDHLKVVHKRESTLQIESKNLSKELMTIKHERHKTINIKDEQINAYRSELKELKTLTAKAAATGGRKSEQNESAVKAFNERKANLLKEIKKREGELEKLKQESADREDAMSKRSFKKETDVESWITRFDQEMQDLNVEFQSTQTAYNEEKARLRELEDYFDRFRLQEHGLEFVECDELATIAETHAKRDRLDSNAIKVQSAIRGHLLRKELLERAKKKGKKGKGKGKGKKK